MLAAYEKGGSSLTVKGVSRSLYNLLWGKLTFVTWKRGDQISFLIRRGQDHVNRVLLHVFWRVDLNFRASARGRGNGDWFCKVVSWLVAVMVCGVCLVCSTCYGLTGDLVSRRARKNSRQVILRHGDRGRLGIDGDLA